MPFGNDGILTDRETCWTGYLSLEMILQSGFVTDSTPLPREAKCKDSGVQIRPALALLFRKWDILEMPSVSLNFFFKFNKYNAKIVVCHRQDLPLH
jgi:hypothetical protein